jgi:DNA-binding NarL/FixJ family response regulator
VIADDHGLRREGVTALLGGHSDVVVIDHTDRLEGLLATLGRTPCDVVLLAARLGADALADVTTLSRHVKVLLVCGDDSEGDVIATLRAGAHGALAKHATLEVLGDAVAAVHAGRHWIDSELQSLMVDGLRSGPARALTRREREVVRLVALGKRNAEVAAILSITEQTVKTHLGHIFRKTGTRDRVALTLYAARLGIITLSDRRS